MSVNHGKIWWSELMTRDPAGAKDYYGRVAGWTFSSMPMEGGEYHVASAGDVMVAGIMDLAAMPGMQAIPPHWFTYIAVDDIDAAVAATRAGGGTIIREPFEVPDVGRIAIISDPTGAAVGLMTPSGPAA